MTYPCGIIKDLLPSYMDDICNEESRAAVQAHLAVCPGCKKYHEDMKASGRLRVRAEPGTMDQHMANGLKKFRASMNRRMRNVILIAAAVVLVLLGGWYLLFQAPVKEVAAKDVSVSAAVYPLEILVQEQSAGHTAMIYADEEDTSKTVTVAIPELGEVTMTESTVAQNPCATVITVSSEYFLRTILWETQGSTMYISAFRTTLLNNKAREYQTSTKSLEFRQLDEIVYLADDGAQIVLWSRE